MRSASVATPQTSVVIDFVQGLRYATSNPCASQNTDTMIDGSDYSHDPLLQPALDEIYEYITNIGPRIVDSDQDSNIMQTGVALYDIIEWYVSYTEDQTESLSDTWAKPDRTELLNLCVRFFEWVESTWQISRPKTLGEIISFRVRRETQRFKHQLPIEDRVMYLIDYYFDLLPEHEQEVPEHEHEHEWPSSLRDKRGQGG